MSSPWLLVISKHPMYTDSGEVVIGQCEPYTPGWRLRLYRRGEEQALCNLGMVYQAMGRWADAGVCHKKSLAICREVGLSTGDDDSLITAGNLDGGQDRWVKTEAWYQQGLAICREADDRVGEGHMLATLAVLKAAQGELHAAVSLGRQAINVLEVTDNAGTLEETQRLLAKWQEQVA